MFFLASQLSGLSKGLLIAIGKDAAAINYVSFIELLGLLIGGCSAGYLVYFCTSSIFLAVIFGLLIAIFLICTQVLTLSSLMMSLEQDISKLKKMQPSSTRAIIFFVIALILSQPIVLGIFNHVYHEQFNQLILDNQLLEKEAVTNKNFMEDHITIKGAKTHNLKNISLEIPKNSLVVIT